MDVRYEVAESGDGFAIVMDRVTDTPVHTGGGQIYVAPIPNAQWTADMLNRGEYRAQHAGDPAPDATPAPVQNPALVEHADRAQAIRDAKPQSEWSLAWQVGAYKSGARAAEKALREVVAMLEDGTAYALRSRVERALNSLESAREVAEAQNPYA